MTLSYPLRLLFLKRTFAWPRSSGHDVHFHGMMRALAALGHEVAACSLQPSPDEALADVPLAFREVIRPQDTGVALAPMTSMQERFRQYWGLERHVIAAVRTRVETWQADALIAGGMDVLPFFPALPQTVTVWYAADELARHHLSLIRLAQPKTWAHVRPAVVKAVYERAFAPCTDIAWAVSTDEQLAMGRYGGFPHCDVLPNGVDADYFAPRAADEHADSLVFWGRLDFEPNIQALEWFVEHVWPSLKSHRPQASLTLMGFHPAPEVLALAQRPGIEVMPNVPDLRTVVCSRAIVVLPFVSGGGIKNKLLEAAALGRAIVCSTKALEGLDARGGLPLVTATSPLEWQHAILRLWDATDERHALGLRARQWVIDRHDWGSVAQLAVASLERALQRRGRTARVVRPESEAI